MPASHVSIRAVKCCAESLNVTEIAFCSSHMHMYLVLYQISVNAMQTKLNYFYFAS